MTVELTAYQYLDQRDFVLEPAPAQRDWMHDTIGKAALRCLPLTIANQAGWVVRSPCTFKAKWTARKAEPSSLVVSFPEKKDEVYASHIKTNFGLGVITMVLPWMFRTSPGYGLWVHGPVNHLRGDAIPLQGLVETDWLPSPFTMNWKILKPKIDVWFKKGDPLCMLTPFPIGMLEDVEPTMRLISDNKEVEAGFLEAAERRRRTNQTGAPARGEFELGYIRGDALKEGESEVQHRTNLKLADFRDAR